MQQTLLSRFPASWILLAVAAVIVGCGLVHRDFPENPGYLRAKEGRSSRLVIFDADTFEVHRRVKFPPSYKAHSHRSEMDPLGCIWVGYTEPCRGLMGCWLRDQRKGAAVFSPEGDRLYDLDVCGVEGGIAFANGYAFIGCGRMVHVVDTDTLAVVTRINWQHPGVQGEAPYWRMATIEEIDGSILIFMRGPPPEGYGKLTNSSSGVTSIAAIDPDTITVRRNQPVLEPVSLISDAVEVDGKAWAFNELSHIKERPPRVDVYVMDPRTLDIVDRFNLENPFPKWARRHADGSIHIFHQVSGERSRRAGFRSGITRMDPTTRAQKFVPTPDNLSVDGFDVY